MFRSIVESKININLPLKTEWDLMEAVEHFNECVQNAAWDSTPATKKYTEPECSKHIRELVAEKRQARKLWQITRYKKDKTRLNYLTAKLKKLIQTERNENVQNHLRNLDVTAASDYSLWKATQRLKRPTASNPPIRRMDGSWAKSDSEKGEAFAHHLAKVFLPNPSKANSKELTDFLDQPYQLDLPIERIKKSEVIETIKNLKQNKAPGYDLITAKVLRELPEIAIRFLMHLFNCILTRGIFPPQWKVAEIKMILKPGKAPEETSSYRPISLLPVLSKVMEILNTNTKHRNSRK
ncbi:unnamed protein product [Euphydryas editha]|uniref:Reverse transcriptase n=1 Tax=Euphydryas editha TaxID=104508 RepID=A0AAU9V972_EUPED|nr:unnamed protein product [Euphydryas editha]